MQKMAFWKEGVQKWSYRELGASHWSYRKLTDKCLVADIHAIVR